MARILFVVDTDSGTLFMSLGPAEHLRARGHEVAFYCAFDIRERLDRAGFHHFMWGTDTRPRDPLSLAEGDLLAQTIRDRDRSSNYVESWLLHGVETRLSPLREALRDFRPTLVVTRGTIYEAVLACETEKIPWVSMGASLAPFMPAIFKSELSEQIEALTKAREELFQRHEVNMRFTLAECVSSRLNLSFTTDEVIGSRINPTYRRVGPSIPLKERGDETDFPWHKLSEVLPVIYFSFGCKTYHQPDVARMLMRAVMGRDVQLIMMVGDLYDELSLEPVPRNVLLFRYVPQLTVLPAVSLFITSGGATSVMEAMHFAVPMLVSPIWLDHPYQAHFIERSGAGLKLDLFRTTIPDCWRHMEILLTAKRFREAVDRIALSFKRNDGSAESARLIENLAQQA